MVSQQKYETDAFESADSKYDITGTLKDEDGNPLSQVDLTIKCEDDGSEYSATTDSDGNFLIENVNPGKYTVTVDSDEYEKTSEEHQVGQSADEDSDSGDKDSSSNDTGASSESDDGESSDDSTGDDEDDSNAEEESDDSDS
jgi:hypothetical protein